jgi:hypothetical protein
MLARHRGTQRRTHGMVQAVLVAAGAAGLLAIAYPAEARSASCTAAFKDGVKLEQAARLREAQKAFAACSKSACGASVRRECIMRYGQLASDIPSVVPVVTDATGEPILDVKVTMDGETLTSQIDGRAVPVDPGLHEFSFTTPAGATRQKIVILQGQRNRPIAVTIGPSQRGAAPRAAVASAPVTPVSPTALVEQEPPVPAAATEPRPMPAEPAAAEEPPSSARPTRSRGSVPAYILSGVGVAGVAGYALLTYWGRKDNDMLAQCTPNCSPGSVSHVKNLYLGANVSLGVGVAALGTATWLYLRSGKGREQVAGNKARPSGYAVDVSPVRAGALASVRGAF